MISAEVSVPVLSVHRIVIAPRSWMDAKRLTMTLRGAIRRAPRDRVTVVIIGSEFGVRPTASATAEHQRIQDRLAEENVRGEHDHDQREREPGDQQAVWVQVALKGR